MRKTRKDLLNWAESLGLTVDIYSPGDGKSRYQFMKVMKNGGNCRIGETHIGLLEAHIFLSGYRSAVNWHNE